MRLHLQQPRGVRPSMALLTDPPITSAIKTKEVIDELLYVCRGRLDRNEDDEWTISVDGAYDSTSAGTFAQGSQGRQTNIVEVGERYRTPVREAVKTLTFEFAPDGDGKFEFTTEARTVTRGFRGGSGRAAELRAGQGNRRSHRLFPAAADDLRGRTDRFDPGPGRPFLKRGGRDHAVHPGPEYRRSAVSHRADPEVQESDRSDGGGVFERHLHVRRRGVAGGRR